MIVMESTRFELSSLATFKPAVKHIAGLMAGEESHGTVRQNAFTWNVYDRQWFPQMVTFTAITVDKIQSDVWAFFLREWAHYEAIDGLLHPTVRPCQDKTLFDSWLALNRREQHIKHRKALLHQLSTEPRRVRMAKAGQT